MREQSGPRSTPHLCAEEEIVLAQHLDKTYLLTWTGRVEEVMDGESYSEDADDDGGGGERVPGTVTTCSLRVYFALKRNRKRTISLLASPLLSTRPTGGPTGWPDLLRHKKGEDHEGKMGVQLGNNIHTGCCI